ncbi:hypothetical protein WN944_019135 [Citrus x changshan-huyou]|uniref:Uncharacterized protein n=1 Tax=Citrus x changshan-huyou TaxID=2935761 RepID=A0AAP0LW17_9ROSI
MCNTFSEAADIPFDDENSYKMVLDCIEKVMKDLPKQIQCGSVEKTNTGGASCSSNKQIHIVICRKGRPPCLRKEPLIHKKSVQRNKAAQKNKDLQENALSSYHVPNEISTQWSNIATMLQEGSTIYSNLNQCGTMGYYNQSIPPYTSQLHYSSPSMTYQGFQTLDGDVDEWRKERMKNGGEKMRTRTSGRDEVGPVLYCLQHWMVMGMSGERNA